MRKNRGPSGHSAGDAGSREVTYLGVFSGSGGTGGSEAEQPVQTQRGRDQADGRHGGLEPNPAGKRGAS